MAVCVKHWQRTSDSWFCWVYVHPTARCEFEEWFEKSMVGSYDLTYRFNSGDPMYTLIIDTDEDAVMFKLKWMNKE